MVAVVLRRSNWWWLEGDLVEAVVTLGFCHGFWWLQACRDKFGDLWWRIEE